MAQDGLVAVDSTGDEKSCMESSALLSLLCFDERSLTGDDMLQLEQFRVPN